MKKRKCKVVIVCLRRIEDYKSIGKLLNAKGYSWYNGSVLNYEGNGVSRVLFIKLGEKKLSYSSASHPWMKPKQAIQKSIDLLSDMYGYDYEDYLVLNTKPSVNKVINELKNVL